jgi:hypothetical protein
VEERVAALIRAAATTKASFFIVNSNFPLRA